MKPCSLHGCGACSGGTAPRDWRNRGRLQVTTEKGDVQIIGSNSRLGLPTYHAGMASAAGGPNWDAISAIGQVLGAVFTAVAVVVALWIAHRDARQRRQDALNASLAQARLVVLNGVRLISGKRLGGRDDYSGQFQIRGNNFGDRPIIDVTFQAWNTISPSQTDNGKPHHETVERICQASGAITCNFDVGTLGLIMAWRILWTDPDGHRWSINGASQEPEIFTGAVFPPRSDLRVDADEKKQPKDPVS